MRSHIKNLDTFRAIAALVVAIGHLELFRDNYMRSSFLSYIPSGHTAVILFFVISGFLITFLLMKELDTYGKISLKDFWLRRIFRIWPVYYLVLLISSFFFDTAPSGKIVAFELAIMPNFSHALYSQLWQIGDITSHNFFIRGWSTSPQIWTIGVENQFYIFFPIIMMLVPRKHLHWVLLLIISGFAILPHMVDFINVRLWQKADISNFSDSFFYGSKFDCLGIGCLAGYVYAENHKWLKWLYNKYLFTISLVVILVWCTNFVFTYFIDEFFALLFAIVILNICTNPNLNINIDNVVTKFLGKISYGIYMYHWIIMLVAFKILPLSDSWYSVVILYLFALGGSILVAWLSFISYEKFFLNIKKRFKRLA